MPSASIVINIGNDPNDYIDVIGKSFSRKRSTVEISRQGKGIKAEIKAADSAALVASIGGFLKQLRIVSGIEMMLEKTRK